MRQGRISTRTLCTVVDGAAVVMAGLLLSANLGDLLHLATHAHAYCPEHAQIVHATAPELSGDRPTPWALDPLHAGLGSAAAPVERGHAHCIHAQLLSRSERLQPAAHADQRAVVCAVVGLPPALLAHASDELCLARAPKTSPPRA